LMKASHPKLPFGTHEVIKDAGVDDDHNDTYWQEDPRATGNQYEGR
jgi:hypothetical protein